MNMVRHDHGCVQNTFSVVRMSAAFESQITGNIWKRPANVGSKGDKR